MIKYSDHRLFSSLIYYNQRLQNIQRFAIFYYLSLTTRDYKIYRKSVFTVVDFFQPEIKNIQFIANYHNWSPTTKDYKICRKSLFIVAHWSLTIKNYKIYRESLFTVCDLLQPEIIKYTVNHYLSLLISYNHRL